MTATDVRFAFGQAAGFFVDTVSSVSPHQWEHPALGEWSVRDLVGHASRALATVEAYLEHPAITVDINDPSEYFLKASASIGQPQRVAQRGREAGAALGVNPPRAAREMTDRVLALVSSTDELQLVATPIGGMRLADYLPTRTFELIVHTLDLATAIGVSPTPPTEALAVTLDIAGELALRSGRGADALLALTGRRSLPPGFSVV